MCQTTRRNENLDQLNPLTPAVLSGQIRELIASPWWPALPPEHRDRWLDQLQSLGRESY